MSSLKIKFVGPLDDELDDSDIEQAEQFADESLCSESYKPDQTDDNYFYNLGDMVWAKVPGHPWWPSMIYYPPDGTKFISTKKSSRSIHVQFFGPLVERAWVPESRLLPYKGYDHFDSQLTEYLQNVKSVSQRSKMDNTCRAKMRPIWNSSWEEADIAFPLSKELRLQRFGRVYVGNSACNPTRKRPREEASSDRESALESAKNSPVKKSEAPDKLAPDEFKFGLANFIDTILLHVDQNNDQKRMELEQEWSGMTVDEQWKFVCQHPDSRKRASRSGRVIKKPLRHLRSPDEETKKRRSSLLSEEPGRRSDRPKPADFGRGAASEELFEIQRLIACPSKYSLQPVCLMCEKYSSSGMLQCRGPCLRWFHKTCVQNISGKVSRLSHATFQCAECEAESPSCFICGNSNSEEKVLICQQENCGRFYHVPCVRSFAGVEISCEGEVDRCPSHFCITCYLDDPKSHICQEGNLLRCVRCPLAYHSGDLCVPAGSLECSQSTVICFNHLKRNEVGKEHVNKVQQYYPYCFVCGQVTKLPRCNVCPAVYHNRCLKPEQRSTVASAFKCPDCKIDRPLCYGQLVWVKVGVHRWWPCEIIHPRNAPHNILKLSHARDTMLMHFLGSIEYQWVRRWQVFRYRKVQKQLSLTKGLDGMQPSVMKEFKEGVRIAKWLHRVYVHLVTSRRSLTSINALPITEEEIAAGYRVKVIPSVKEKREDATDESSSTKPSKKIVQFKFINENEPIGKAKILKNLSQILECNCTPDMSAPCSIESACQNIEMCIECDSDLCPAGPRCQNQKFVKRDYPLQSVFDSGDRGKGLKAMEFIKEGAFVNEYVGELITTDEALKRLSRAQQEGITDFYMLQLDKERVIDAGPKGNLSRYLNHSCSPNLVARKWMVNGDLRIGIFAKCDIQVNEELTFDYQFMVYGEERIPCLCEATNCSGYLGMRPLKQSSSSSSFIKKIFKRNSSSLLTSSHVATTDFTDSNRLTNQISSSAPDTTKSVNPSESSSDAEEDLFALIDTGLDESDVELCICAQCKSIIPSSVNFYIGCPTCSNVYHPECARMNFKTPSGPLPAKTGLDWKRICELFHCWNCRKSSSNGLNNQDILSDEWNEDEPQRSITNDEQMAHLDSNFDNCAESDYPLNNTKPEIFQPTEASESAEESNRSTIDKCLELSRASTILLEDYSLPDKSNSNEMVLEDLSHLKLTSTLDSADLCSMSIDSFKSSSVLMESESDSAINEMMLNSNFTLPQSTCDVEMRTESFTDNARVRTIVMSSPSSFSLSTGEMMSIDSSQNSTVVMQSQSDSVL